MISNRQTLLIVVLFFIFTAPAVAEQRIYKLQCDSTPPYIFWADKRETNVTGLWADVVRAVMNRMGEKHEEFRIHPWGRLLEMGLKGEVDGVFGATMNEERLKYMRFPKEPLIEDPWVFWIRKSDIGKLKFTSYADLKGYRIGLVKDYTYTKEFWDFVKKEQNYEEVVHDSLNFRKLAMGRLDYIVSALRFGAYIAKEEGIADKVHPLSETPVVNSVFYIMFNKKNVSQEWTDRFSGHLAEFKKTEEYGNLMKKYGLLSEK